MGSTIPTIEGRQVTSHPRESQIGIIQEILGASTPLRWLSEPKGSNSTKVFFTDWNRDYPVNSPSELLAHSAGLEESRDLRVCIIENISAEYIETLGSAWNIDAEFFAVHAKNPDRNRLWERKEWQLEPRLHIVPGVREQFHSQPRSPVLRDGHSFLHDSCDYLDGIFEYHNEYPNLEPSVYQNLSSSPNIISRHCFKDSRWPIQSSTRISYCRPDKITYLFLVDPPVEFSSDVLDRNSRSFPTLRFPNSKSRGGVELPRLLFDFQDRHSLFENLKIFFQHSWHQTALFDLYFPTTNIFKSFKPDVDPGVIPAYPFVYLWASCLWEEDLRRLKKEIKRISFREIRDPRLEINAELHDRREDLAYLQDGLAETSTYVPDNVKAYFENTMQSATRAPIRNFEHLAKEATALQGFLMETFQLFMSSISVQDARLSLEQSRLSIEQAQRGSRLTLLAFVYVPLSFVTGIFGMNIQQVNGSGLSIWVCFVVGAVAVFVTLLLFWLVKLYGDWNQNSDSPSRRMLNWVRRIKPEGDAKMA